MTGRRGQLLQASAGVASLAAIVAVLAGCAGPTAPTSSGAVTPSPAATETTVPTPTPTSTDRGDCDADQLSISVQSRPADSGMSSFFWDLQLTNTSSAECTVEGYPAVSLIGSNSGEPVGAVSENEPGRWFTAALVPLPPGASAYSLLHLTQAGAYGCTVVPVTEIAVTPPHWDAARRVATPGPIDGCDDDSTVLVRAGPLAPARVTF
jgi:hypothetical protein